MDNSETLDNLRKRMMARLANSGEGPDAGNVQKVLAKDQNIRKAIAESVNTYFYYIGGGFQDFKGLGLERINLRLTVHKKAALRSLFY